jgi:hypothetical protein
MPTVGTPRLYASRNGDTNGIVQFSLKGVKPSKARVDEGAGSCSAELAACECAFRVIAIDGIARNVAVGLFGLVDERVHGDELAGDGVVVAVNSDLSSRQ